MVETELKNEPSQRNPMWSEAVAMGSEYYIQEVEKRLGGRAVGRSVVSSNNGTIVLKEPNSPYSILFAYQKGLLRQDNTFFLAINS